MAPRAKTAGLASLIESDSEPDFDSFDAAGKVSSGQSSSSQKKTKVRGRPVAANRVTKTVRNATRQATAKAVISGQIPPRRALVDKSNTSAPGPLMSDGKPTQDEDEITMVGQLEATEQNPPRATRGRPRASKNRKDVVTSNSTATSTSAPGPYSATDGPAIIDEVPETQAAGLITTDEESGQMTKRDEHELWIFGTEHDPNHGVSEQDMDNASAFRRLRDLGKRFESLETRYRDLREVGVKVAEHNFERLKRQTEENATAANKLISQLKEEIAVQSKMLQQAELLRQRLERSEEEASALRAQLSDVNGALSEARCEIKTISAKLAASRTVEANVKASTNGPKGAATGNRTAYMETLQAAQAKEDLYGDLTGLIVRDVRRGNKDDVFDCIQTGRNGTLHFKLSLERMDATENYEDVQFTYRPQLDASRDSDLMEVLPDYLTEEITFPRPHASKFYTRVTKSLMERLD